MAGGVVLSGPGEACVDALRCAAFLVRQHPQDLKEALDSMNASRSISPEGGEGGGVWWLEGLWGALQGLVGQASGKSRRRRKRKKRRKGQAGEEQEFEGEEEATASEDEEDEQGEASGGAWRAEGGRGGQTGRGQQRQQGGAAAAASGQPTEQPGGMEVDPAASVSMPVRPRADLVRTSSTTTTTSTAVRRAAVAEALSLADVVGSIFSFLVGVGEASTGRQSVRQLGQLGLVCGKWREVSLWEAWWVGAAEEVLPAMVWGRGEGGDGTERGRRRVLEHGRMVWCERRVWCGPEEWVRGLSVHFEVFDRMDGLQMLSAQGTLDAVTAADGLCMWLGIGPGRRWEVVGRPFSAASRDPEQRRFPNVRDFFERGHEEDFASSVCVRVSVTDERTGRRVLLWEEEGKGVPREITAVDADVQPWVGEEALQVETLEWQPLTCSAYGGTQLRGYVGFVVELVAGQAEGVSEQERLYQLAGADEQNYDQHESFVKLGIRVSEGDVAVGNMEGMVRGFVRSLLDMGHH